MKTSESIVNITKAVIDVMKKASGVEKSLDVGTGKNTYKGVADKDVKKLIGELMTENGLAIFTIDIDENADFTKWEEAGQYGTKHKQNVFTEVKTTYLLTHTSGEFIQIKGYGHGVDTQDKSAGKATTYALKNALLYTFLVPTGKIDDTDNTHSNQYEDPKTQTEEQKGAIAKAREDVLKVLNNPKNEAYKTQMLNHYKVEEAEKLNDEQILGIKEHLKANSKKSNK